MAKKKNNHGGARSKAGRKHVSDPKLGVTIYVHASIIEANGGIEIVKERTVLFLQKSASKINSVRR